MAEKTIFELANDVITVSVNAAVAGESETLSTKRWRELNQRCRETQEVFFAELRRRFPSECAHQWMFWRREPRTYRCRICDAKDIRDA